MSDEQTEQPAPAPAPSDEAKEVLALQKLLQNLKVTELQIGLLGKRHEGGSAVLRGTALTTLGREYATVVVERRGWKVDNQLGASGPPTVAAVDSVLKQAQAQLDEGHPEAALALYRAVTLAAPDDRRAWGRRGTLLANLGRKDEALEHLHKWEALKNEQAPLELAGAGEPESESA